jgi:ketosteroid isomerase-like protein
VLATNQDVRRGRSLIEHVGARYPALAQLLARWMLLLPSDSPLRARFIWWGASRIYAAFNRRDWDMNMILFDERRYEFRAGDLGAVVPGTRPVYEGRTGYLEVMGLFLDVFAGMRVRLEEVIPIGRDRAVMIVRFSGTGKASGAAVDQRNASVIDLEDGRIVRQTYWWDVEKGVAWARSTAGEPPK